MATNGTQKQQHAVIGNASSFWLWSSKTGFDLTHPPKPDSPRITPSVTLETTTSPITVDPAKSALIVIDMQNFFLSPALGRKKGPGHLAVDQLVSNAIPACRKAGIRVVWVNWGLTEQEIEDMPPAVKRAFGFETLEDGVSVDKHGKDGRIYKGLGVNMGVVRDPGTGEEIEAGRMLMRGQWNAELCPALHKLYEEGKGLKERPDVWVHKNRMSGMWGSGTDLEKFLEKEGLKTLFFTGVNTDQCVGGTYQDCFSKGYDCVLLSDGCGTTSPSSAQECIEFNAANTWGFAASCKQLAEGVEEMG